MKDSVQESEIGHRLPCQPSKVFFLRVKKKGEYEKWRGAGGQRLTCFMGNDTLIHL